MTTHQDIATGLDRARRAIADAKAESAAAPATAADNAIAQCIEAVEHLHRVVDGLVRALGAETALRIDLPRVKIESAP